MSSAAKRIAPIMLFILIVMFAVSACEAEVPRVPAVVTYNPGPAFSTNMFETDPRRQVKCSVVFEVLDEQAVTDLEGLNYRIRSSVFFVLRGLTIEQISDELTLDEIAEMIVEKVNEDLNLNTTLVLRAFFTDFVII